MNKQMEFVISSETNNTYIILVYINNTQIDTLSIYAPNSNIAIKRAEERYK